jgi:hypothetical protein
MPPDSFMVPLPITVAGVYPSEPATPLDTV